MDNANNILSIILDDEDGFNSKLFIDIGKYETKKEDNFNFTENEQFSNQSLEYNNFQIQNYLSKDLLETIDSSSIEGKNKNIICPDKYTSEKSNEKSPLNDSLKKNDVNKEENIEKKKNSTPLTKNNICFIPKTIVFNRKYKEKKIIERRKGDWDCSFCNNLNFAFRIICNRCGASKLYKSEI